MRNKEKGYENIYRSWLRKYNGL